VILVGLTLFALTCFGIASHCLDDGNETAPTGESHTLDALLFLLCLIGIVAAHKRKSDEDEF
jgi:hypothetical protein